MAGRSANVCPSSATQISADILMLDECCMHASMQGQKSKAACHHALTNDVTDLTSFGCVFLLSLLAAQTSNVDPLTQQSTLCSHCLCLQKLSRRKRRSACASSSKMRLRTARSSMRTAQLWTPLKCWQGEQDRDPSPCTDLA